jgi:hypothetical protein
MSADLIIEDMLNRNPLIGLSVYTDIQSRTIRDLGLEILTCLEAGIVPDNGGGKGTICGDAITRGYGQFWLWVIGAYEVVRTMCQAERCFSQRVRAELKALKRRLAVLRMPFAKQERPGKSVPVRAEPSVYGIDDLPPDIRFEVEGQVVSARELITEFAQVFGGIARADILADQRTTSSPGAASV